MKSPSRHPLELSVCAERFGFQGQLMSDVAIASRLVDVVVEIDHRELERRQEFQLEPLRNIDALRELGLLPHQVPIPIDHVDPFTLALLGTFPRGLIEFGSGSLTRVWKPALSISGFLVATPDWRRGLARVSLFAGDGPRGLVYTGVRRSTALVREASAVGVGVGALSGSDLSILLPPDRGLVKSGIAQWDLREELLNRYLSGSYTDAFAQRLT